MPLLKTLVRKLERKNAHQRKVINSHADKIISTELLRRACIDNHQLLQNSREKVMELEGERKEWEEEMAQVNQENLRLREEIQRVSSTSDALKRKMDVLEQENSRLRMKVVTIKEEVKDEKKENARPTKATSYLYEADNGAVSQAVKVASAAHFFYRGHFSKSENYTRWSELGTAERAKWTKKWAKMRKVQKEQAAQGFIILRSQIKEELEDEPKWAMVLRRRN
ncbi:Protein CBG26212 [Caenorhabditis briggsae]|uniref:Protein CBG26212 n=1 Tax=Caenorhabditis briggsae TaxID=6238 RepID=B6ILV7_CAEBR|nr:Protein CBG26212 [Caenorhabditis briggsae]CAS00887.1 Protein CBG26212 [Caenorhabditis briggsae]